MASQTLDDPFATLARLEESLWRAETLGDRSLMDATFSDDFFEFGRSGRVWNRDELLSRDCPPMQAELPLPALDIRLLNDFTALITYNSIVTADTIEYARRSSVWSLQHGRWRLRFHQGTPFTPAAAQGA